MNYLFIIIFILLIIYLFKNNGDRRDKINSKIPGPPKLPILGNLLSMNGNLHLKFEEWYKKYGTVYRIKMGQIDTVVLTEYPTIRKAFIENSDIFKSRFRYNSRFQINGCQDIAMENGEKHTLLKKVLLSEMTPTRIKKLENNNIVKECEKLINLLDKLADKGEQFIINDYFCMFTLNITLRLIFGVDYPYNQIKESEGIVNAIKEFLLIAGIPIASDFLPFIKPNTSKFMEKYDVLIKEVDKLIKKYQNSKQQYENGNDNDHDEKLILDQLIKEFEKGNITWENVTNTIIDMIIAGGDTSSNTMIFTIIELINNQEIQFKLYNSISTAIVGEEEVMITHNKYRSLIPFLSIVIKEIFRKYPISLIGLPHETSEDVEIDGNLIAKGTQIIQNIYATHRSEKYYNSPDEFIPERFLELSNKEQTNLIQFGCGVRDCLGKNLGESLIFTLLATLFKRYEFINPISTKPLIDIGTFGITYQPPTTNIIIKKRLLIN